MAENPYLEAADAAADYNSIPRSIFHALINTESGWNAYAISNKGAIGLTQLMPATAAQLGVFAWSPRENLLGGAAYLKQMFAKFGNWGDALAAYNAGPGNIAAGKGYAKKVLTDAAAEEDAAPVPAGGAAPTKDWWQQAADWITGKVDEAQEQAKTMPGTDSVGAQSTPNPITKAIDAKLTGVAKYGAAGVIVLILLTIGLIMLAVGGWQSAKSAAGVRS